METLHALELGELSASTESKLLEHLTICTVCQAAWDTLECPSNTVTRLLSELPVTSADEAAFSAAQRALLESGPRPDALLRENSVIIARTEERAAGRLGDEADEPGLNYAAGNEAAGQGSATSRLESLGNLPGERDGVPFPQAFALATDEQAIPKQLREYELLEPLGRGGTSCVFKARHLRLDRYVAIKVLATGPQQDGEARSRFLEEMKTAGGLNHPHIVHATDAGEDQGIQFLVMEYLPGLDLGTVVRKLGPLPLEQACEVIRQAALGLEHARKNGLVHRDVKPSNLLLTGHGTVKVLDLGLAGVSAPGGTDGRSDQIRGTADYMPPEQWADFDSVDARADVYSLGCSLFKLVTGQPPFRQRGQSLVDKRLAHLEAPIPVLRLGTKPVPPGLQSLVAKLLAKRPEDRLQSPGDVAKSLEPWCGAAGLKVLVDRAGIPFLGPPPVASLPPSRLGRLQRQLLILGTLLAATALAWSRPWELASSVGRHAGNRPLDLAMARPLSVAYGKPLPELELAKLNDPVRLRLSARELAGVLLGQPVGPKYQLAVTAKPVTASSWGVLFSVRANGLPSRAYGWNCQAIRVEKLSGDRPEVLLKWSLLFWGENSLTEKFGMPTPQGSTSTDSGTARREPVETAVTELKMEGCYQEQVLATARLPDQGTGETLAVSVGSGGPPGVIWRGNSLPVSAWKTSDAQLWDALNEEIPAPGPQQGRPGWVGLLVSGGTVELNSAQLTYLEE